MNKWVVRAREHLEFGPRTSRHICNDKMLVCMDVPRGEVYFGARDFQVVQHRLHRTMCVLSTCAHGICGYRVANFRLEILHRFLRQTFEAVDYTRARAVAARSEAEGCLRLRAIRWRGRQAALL